MHIVYCDQCGYIKGCFEKNNINCQICNNTLKYIENVETDQYVKIFKMNRLEQNKYIESLSGRPIDLSYKDKLLDFEIEHHNKNQQKIKSIPKCPTCQSTNIRKMGGVERGASIWAFGLFSKKINKTFKCNHCGYTW